MLNLKSVVTSVVKLVWISDASVRFEGTLEVTQGSSCSKQKSTLGSDQVVHGFIRLGLEISKDGGSTMPLGPCCFLSSEWKMLSLNPDWTSPVLPSLILLPRRTVKSLALLALSSCWPPPGYPYGWAKGSNCFPPATGCASVGTAQRAVGFPPASCLTDPRSSEKLGLMFLSLRQPAAQVSFTTGSLFWEVGDITEVCGTQSQGFCKQGNGNNPCEISHVNFTAGGGRGN